MLKGEPALSVVTNVTTSRSFSCTVDYLVKNWDLLQMRMEIPKNAKIVVCVPGGGDYSSCDWKAEETEARVSWTTTHTDMEGVG